jgi:DNA-binding transcriptional LysR family regulator
MDLITHLRSFVAVAESGSVTAAAAEVRAPQPVVSRRIIALEKHLGSALFTRTGRRVRITETGRRLLPHAIDLVARADRLLELAATAPERTLRIGIPMDADLQAMAAASRVAAAAGFRLDVVTAAKEERTAGDGLQVALVDSPVDTATAAVVIGIATGFARPPAVSSPESGWPARKDGPFHLDELRRRRNAPGESLRKAFLCPEDDVPELRREVTARIARAGLSPTQFEVPESVAGAVTRVHAGDGVLLCGRQLARRHGLLWRPLGGTPLVHGYTIATNLPAAWAADAGPVIDAIAPHLSDAIGGQPPATAAATTQARRPPPTAPARPTLADPVDPMSSTAREDVDA